MKYVVVGAGDYALNIVDFFNIKDQVIYFYDNPREPNELRMGKPVIKNGQFTIPNSFLVHFNGVGDPRHKRELIESLINANWKVMVHPKSQVSESVVLNKGVVVLPFAVVERDVILGRHVIVDILTCVGHDSIIGDYCTVTPQVFIGASVTIGNGVFLGAGCKILPDLTVGDGSFIGAGALITKDVEPNSVMVGSPAKCRKTLEEWKVDV